VLVIDSVAALTPRAELEGEMGDSLPGLQARLMSQALRKLTGSISKSRCMVIFINQIRMKIGTDLPHKTQKTLPKQGARAPPMPGLFLCARVSQPLCP